MVREASYTAVFEPAEEGGFVVTFPAIPGLATQGETLDEARAMAVDCLRTYLESLEMDGEEPPYEAPGTPVTERVKVALTTA
ncbi:MAG TPA: type II toxin-antitoxin system HicB family antitoxin [Terriglobales bacterium]|nr:type II toxin-antitoxin system HicB family antitoxin [Terriglobales bacterium]